MSRKSIFTVAGGAALGLLFAAGILWVELLAAEAEYVEEQEPVSPPVAEVIRQETPQEAAYTNESTMTVTAYCPCEKCCGAYSNGYTATGAKATQGVTIATDPDVIPMGTEVEIDGHIYIIKKAKGFMQTFDAKLVVSGKLNFLAYCFRAKNYYGMVDKQEMVLTPNQPQIEGLTPEQLQQKYIEASDFDAK